MATDAILGRFQIGHRLAAGFSVLIVFFCVLGALAIASMAMLADLTDRLYQHPFAVSNAVLEVRADTVAIHRSLKEVALAQDEAGIDVAAANIDRYEAQIYAEIEIIDGRFLGDRSMVDAVRTAIVDFKPIRDRFIGLMRDGERAQAGEIIVGAGAEQIRQINEAVSALYDFSEAKAAEFMAHSDTVRDRTMMAMWAALGLSVIVGGSVAFVISRSITGPLRAMSECLNGLSSGDVSVAVPGGDRHDEFGGAAAAMTVFKTSLIEKSRLEADQAAAKQQADEERRSTIDQLSADLESGIGEVVRSVSQSANEMQAFAQSMAVTASGNSKESDAVAMSAEQAVYNVQTVASAAEELVSSIAEISRQMSVQTDAADDAQQSALASDDQIKGLASKVEAIGSVVSLITNIAEQTNLLALNATIEAARAGDAGKGFAVVASEVKNLANQTAKATEEIATQIKDVQDQTDGAVQAIADIAVRIDKIKEISSSVAVAVEQQNAAVSEIGRSAQDASADTAQVSASISTVRAASDKSGESARAMLVATEDLSQQSDELARSVGAYLNRMRAA